MEKHILKGDANRQVWLDGELLDPKPSQKVYNHSPDGFNWGYGGSGPSLYLPSTRIVSLNFSCHRAE